MIISPDNLAHPAALHADPTWSSAVRRSGSSGSRGCNRCTIPPPLHPSLAAVTMETISWPIATERERERGGEKECRSVDTQRLHRLFVSPWECTAQTRNLSLHRYVPRNTRKRKEGSPRCDSDERATLPWPVFASHPFLVRRERKIGQEAEYPILEIRQRASSGFFKAFNRPLVGNFGLDKLGGGTTCDLVSWNTKTSRDRGKWNAVDAVT